MLNEEISMIGISFRAHAEFKSVLQILYLGDNPKLHIKTS